MNVKHRRTAGYQQGDRVVYHDDSTDPPIDYRGTVQQIGYSAMRIAWDDGAPSTLFALTDKRTERIEKVEEL